MRSIGSDAKVYFKGAMELRDRDAALHLRVNLRFNAVISIRSNVI